MNKSVSKQQKGLITGLSLIIFTGIVMLTSATAVQKAAAFSCSSCAGAASAGIGAGFATGTTPAVAKESSSRFIPAAKDSHPDIHHGSGPGQSTRPIIAPPPPPGMGGGGRILVPPVLGYHPSSGGGSSGRSFGSSSGGASGRLNGYVTSIPYHTPTQTYLHPSVPYNYHTNINPYYR